MGGNVREKLEEAPRIKIRGFNFRGEIFDCLMLSNVNFELGTRGEILPSTRIDGTLQCRVLRERLVSQARPNQPQHGSLSGY